MQLRNIGLLSLTLPLAATMGCSSEYDLGDAQPQGNPKADAGSALPVDTARPPVDRNLPFRCDEWGNGEQLASPSASLSSALSAIWSGQNATDGQQKYIGQVATTGDLECVVRDALEDARARPFVGAFYAKWLNVAQTPAVAVDRTIAPDRFAIMANDVVNFAVNVSVAGEGNFSRLMTSARPLASAGTPLSPGIVDSLAAGVLSDQAVIYANTMFGLPSDRGWWFQRVVNCVEVPPERPRAQPSSLGGSGSYRQRLNLVVGQGSCSACHKLTDFPGFALHPFDEMGRVRQADQFGFPFDTSGRLHSGRTETSSEFADLRQLGQIVANSNEAATCFAARWQQFALGKDVDETSDFPDIAVEAAGKLRRNNGSITAVIADAVRRAVTQP